MSDDSKFPNHLTRKSGEVYAHDPRRAMTGTVFRYDFGGSTESDDAIVDEMCRRYGQHTGLVDALKKAAIRNPEDGPCFCVVPIPVDTAHHLSCQHIRSVLNAAKGGV